MSFPEYLKEKIGQPEFYKPQLCEMCANYKNFWTFLSAIPKATSHCSKQVQPQRQCSSQHQIALQKTHCLCRQCLQPSPSRHTRLGGDPFPCRVIYWALFWYLCKVKVCLLFTLWVLSPSTVITSPTHCVCSSDVERKLQLTKERDRILRSPQSLEAKSITRNYLCFFQRRVQAHPHGSSWSLNCAILCSTSEAWSRWARIAHIGLSSWGWLKRTSTPHAFSASRKGNSGQQQMASWGGAQRIDPF